jgi:hydroxypyruvate isomerase
LVGMVGTSQPLTDPNNMDAAIVELKQNIAIAQDIRCQSLIVTSGPQQPNVEPQVQHDTIVDILKAVAPSAETANITIVLEPLNTIVNHPGTYLSSSFEGYDIIREVGSSKVKLLFDIYHQQITEGNIIANITEHMELIGHFHLADVPGRREPGTGELNYANIFKAIADSDYQGYVGCEFSPSGTSVQALEYIKTLL